MPGINLLPKDLAPNPKIQKISGYLRNLMTIGLSIFVLSLLAVVAYFSINSVILNNSIKNQETLKQNIRSFEQTEQGLFLLKDRLAKISEVGKKQSLKEEINNLYEIITLIPPEINVTESILGKGSIEMTYLTNNSSNLTKLMSSIILNKKYKRIDLLSFSFNSNVGYIVSVKFLNK